MFLALAKHNNIETLLMDWTEILGITAGICTTISVIPQIRKAWKTKKVEDVSPRMFIVLTMGIFLWIVYGITQNDLPIILTNSTSLSLNAVVLYLLLRYRKGKTIN